MTSFIYDARTKTGAILKWRQECERLARHAGARGTARKLLAQLKIQRIAKRELVV